MQPTVLLMGLFAAFAVAAPTAPGSSTDVTSNVNSNNPQDNSQNVEQTQTLPISIAHDGILSNDDIVKNVDVTALNDVANDLTAAVGVLGTASA
ncbi:uncharacterized protein BO66DRAFT_474666 [Aspergillus aculeatinus CBS 121060]|uniref:Uncharacterized protein n=1 Tax=Aspergillus aculeatinus CBS 121060 TaxID=1448322 RepID=A0ACD1GX90_9EURO|nr:hypothetical protein BO66DRAFT_474666 [Aspergillus aculeatinus CBS 121060]RAH65932.1 hypothetical protein BO66DRAFT_474666 [Aspergillus aculeatinus CBS 121060]